MLKPRNSMVGYTPPIAGVGVKWGIGITLLVAMGGASAVQGQTPAPPGSGQQAVPAMDNREAPLIVPGQARDGGVPTLLAVIAGVLLGASVVATAGYVFWNKLENERKMNARQSAVVQSEPSWSEARFQEMLERQTKSIQAALNGLERQLLETGHMNNISPSAEQIANLPNQFYLIRQDASALKATVSEIHSQTQRLLDVQDTWAKDLGNGVESGLKRVESVLKQNEDGARRRAVQAQDDLQQGLNGVRADQLSFVPLDSAGERSWVERIRNELKELQDLSQGNARLFVKEMDQVLERLFAVEEQVQKEGEAFFRDSTSQRKLEALIYRPRMSVGWMDLEAKEIPDEQHLRSLRAIETGILCLRRRVQERFAWQWKFVRLPIIPGQTLYDPEFHESGEFNFVETEDPQRENIIFQVVNNGFSLNGKVLTKAVVKRYVMSSRRISTVPPDPPRAPVEDDPSAEGAVSNETQTSPIDDAGVLEAATSAGSSTELEKVIEGAENTEVTHDDEVAAAQKFASQNRMYRSGGQG